MRRYGYLVVEGPHDVEFCYRLLSVYGLTRVRMLADLDEALKQLVPNKFPPDGDLQKRVPVPLFLQSDQYAIAIHSAIGDSRLVATLEETLEVVDAATFVGLGIMLDADSNDTVSQRYASLCEKLTEIKLTLPKLAGEVTSGPPRIGAFVLPDNTSPGTLEDLLLESAKTQYGELLPKASNYVEAAIKDGLIPVSHRDEIVKKAAGRNKAVIGAMASLFKPGKAIQNSIQDNDWLRGAALEIPSIQTVQQFLVDLFELPLPKSGTQGFE